MLGNDVYFAIIYAALLELYTLHIYTDLLLYKKFPHEILRRQSTCSPGKDATFLDWLYNNATLNKKPFVLCSAFYLILMKGE